MKIDSYNVGYGPKLLAFNESYKDGTLEYTLRAFPLGGYVAFPSNVQYDELDEEVLTRTHTHIYVQSTGFNILLVLN